MIEEVILPTGDTYKLRAGEMWALYIGEDDEWEYLELIDEVTDAVQMRNVLEEDEVFEYFDMEPDAFVSMAMFGKLIPLRYILEKPQTAALFEQARHE